MLYCFVSATVYSLCYSEEWLCFELLQSTCTCTILLQHDLRREEQQTRDVYKGQPEDPFLGHSSRKHIQRGSGELQKIRTTTYLNEEVRPGHTRVTCQWVVQGKHSLELCQVAIHAEIQQQSLRPSPPEPKAPAQMRLCQKKVLFMIHLFCFGN